MPLNSTTEPILCACGCGQPILSNRPEYMPRYRKGHHFRRPLPIRFWEKVKRSGPHECWLWMGAVNHDGIGHLWDGDHVSEACRVSWELHNGPAPDGLAICHNRAVCRTLLCVNPLHLMLQKRGRDREMERGICACGCGQLLNETKFRPSTSRRFILGHGRRVPIEERFWKKVNKTATCWLWTDTLSPDGYGSIGDRTRKTPKVRAHRYSWEIHYGPIPDGLIVCHKCDNPACVRPDHLFLGTDKTNSDDKVKKGRQGGPNGEMHPSAKLTETQVQEIRQKQGSMSGPRIAAEYGVSSTVIYGIWKGAIWRTVS